MRRRCCSRSQSLASLIWHTGVDRPVLTCGACGRRWEAKLRVRISEDGSRTDDVRFAEATS